MFTKITSLLLLGSIASAAQAQCQNNPLLTRTDSALNVTMVTMNRLGIASYSAGTILFNAGGGRQRVPPHWQTITSLSQTFSDRYLGTNSDQNFNTAQSDKITLRFTVGVSPQGTIVLNSHGNGVSTFPLTCSNTGIVHGATADVKYLFYFSVQPPIP